MVIYTFFLQSKVNIVSKPEVVLVFLNVNLGSAMSSSDNLTAQGNREQQIGEYTEGT